MIEMTQEEQRKGAAWAAQIEEEFGVVQVGGVQGKPPPAPERALQSYAYLIERFELEVKRESVDEDTRGRYRDLLKLLDYRNRKTLASLGDVEQGREWRARCAALDGALLKLERDLVRLLGADIRQWLPVTPAMIGERRDSVRAVLEARKLELGAHGAVLDACLDPLLLRQWLVRAATANAIEEVFAVAS